MCRFSDFLSLPADHSRHLDHEEFLLLFALKRCGEAADGWAREKQSVLAMRIGRSPIRTKQLLRSMRARRVIASQHEAGEAGSYRIEPPAKWLPLEQAVKPRASAPALRMRSRDGAMALIIPGRGIAELQGEPEVKLGAKGRTAVTVTGADLASLRIPPTARVEIADDVALVPHQAASGRAAERAQKAPGLPATPVPSSNGKAPAVAQSVPGLPATHPITQQGSVESVPGLPATPPRARLEEAVLACAAGSVKVWFPAGRRLTTGRERELLRRMSPAEAAQMFIAKGFRAMACSEESEEVLTMARKPRITLDGAPTGVWSRLLARLRRSLNERTYATWFSVTAEAGTCAKKIIVLVPAEIFARRLKTTYANLIATGLADIGERGARIEFCVRTELPEEIPARESGAGVKERQNQSQRRIA